MATAIILLASQALALAAPAADLRTAHGARVSATATVVILQAETTREEAGPRALKSQHRIGASGRVSIEFE